MNNRLQELVNSPHIKEMDIESHVGFVKRRRINKRDVMRNQKNWLVFKPNNSKFVYITGWSHCSLQSLLDSPDFEAFLGRKLEKSAERDAIIKLILLTKEKYTGCQILNKNLGIFSQI